MKAATSGSWASRPTWSAGVYLGFDQPRSLGEKATGGRYSAPIFRDFMMEALKNEPATPFRVPPGIRLVRVDYFSGERAAPGAGKVIWEAFKPGTEPTGHVNVIQGVANYGQDAGYGSIIPIGPASEGGQNQGATSIINSTGGYQSGQQPATPTPRRTASRSSPASRTTRSRTSCRPASRRPARRSRRPSRPNSRSSRPCRRRPWARRRQPRPSPRRLRRPPPTAAAASTNPAVISGCCALDRTAPIGHVRAPLTSAPTEEARSCVPRLKLWRGRSGLPWPC